MKTITKIATQKKLGRYSIDLDKQFAFGVSESVLIKYGLAKGRELDDTLIEQIKHDDEVAKAFNTAINYLGHALRTIKQVKQKLTEKAVSEDIQVQVVAQLKELGYLDDANYAMHYVSTKKLISPKGPNTIKMDLQQAGILEDDIEKALASYTYEEQIEIAQKMAIKFANTYKRESTRAKQQKIIQALANKGFSFDIGQTVVSELDVGNDDTTELDNVKRQAEKLWHRYRNEPLSQRQYKTKSHLYTKGYSREVIDTIMLALESES
ncbi:MULTISPECIES: recombination regulator RecX [Leuconostoc]|uniref:Regulatory protein RecX n=2 Tax=Leuconostoc TaxID=1243 RepID=A0AAN2UF19_9LACO|nr:MULTISPECIES: recombination regulator RecX [Leuconostoc]MBZ5948377.1 recombination regulator RecX [Leuconostoc gasicomitatum]MBZ5952027.1 recombination regulator RecX [Leuconostoc gasicomitatum]MBZ5952800.1 recombination regulator RecX [Leuconostoc gasicomitatum]MBZ5954421.1 recombination regulator RecX [Leuconostoc gasicomitatum]MBZ5957506.1 recombination regulator RecX [Leuconostoc gasicomitatum]